MHEFSKEIPLLLKHPLAKYTKVFRNYSGTITLLINLPFPSPTANFRNSSYNS